MLNLNKQLQHVNGTARRAGAGDGHLRAVYSGLSNGRSSATGLEDLSSSQCAVHTIVRVTGPMWDELAWTMLMLSYSRAWGGLWYPTGVLCPLPLPRETPDFQEPQGAFSRILA